MHNSHLEISLDPITRIEGHLKVDVVLENGTAKEAKCAGTLYRGFENILRGRHPLDALRITQRVCGVCPTGHATASSLNLDSAFGIGDKIPENGRIVRNLILGSNFLQSHILHFYHLAALDYVDVTKAANYKGGDKDLKSIAEFIDAGHLAPFFPRFEGDYRLSDEENLAALKHYVEALEIRKACHEMLTIFGGKMPHNVATVAGGVSGQVSVDKITNFLWRLDKIKEFIARAYIPDVLLVASRYPDYFDIGKGCGKFLSYGVFDLEVSSDYLNKKRLHSQGRASLDSDKVSVVDPSKITESVKSSWYKNESDPLHPSRGQTNAATDKKEAYSFLKSPRYDGEVYEVGPLARMIVSYKKGNKAVAEILEPALKKIGDPQKAVSVLGRHLCRALETKLVADKMAEWVLQLKPGGPLSVEFEIPKEAEGAGFTEAPRGALGHWISIKDSKIANYQMVVPTTWNASPKDNNGKNGAMEQAITGTKVKDGNNPFEPARIVRSFDPCLACSVHVITPKGRDLRKFRVV